MANKWTRHAATLLTLIFSPLAFAQEDDFEKRTAEVATAPDAVRLAVAREFPRAEIVASTVERHELGDAWRVRLKDRLTTRDVVMDPGGGLIAHSEGVPPAFVPVQIRRALARQFGSPSIWHAQHASGVGEEAWLVTFSRRDRVGQAVFDASGRLVRAELEATSTSNRDGADQA